MRYTFFDCILNSKYCFPNSEGLFSDPMCWVSAIVNVSSAILVIDMDIKALPVVPWERLLHMLDVLLPFLSVHPCNLFWTRTALCHENRGFCLVNGLLFLFYKETKHTENLRITFPEKFLSATECSWMSLQIGLMLQRKNLRLFFNTQSLFLCNGNIWCPHHI